MIGHRLHRLSFPFRRGVEEGCRLQVKNHFADS